MISCDAITSSENVYEIIIDLICKLFIYPFRKILRSMADLRNSIDVADCSLINLAEISYQLLQMQLAKLPSKLQQVSGLGLYIFDPASSLTAYLVIIFKKFYISELV